VFCAKAREIESELQLELFSTAVDAEHRLLAGRPLANIVSARKFKRDDRKKGKDGTAR
jgi:hypothetical protein